jgi:hypothetical protein
MAEAHNMDDMALAPLPDTLLDQEEDNHVPSDIDNNWAALGLNTNDDPVESLSWIGQEASGSGVQHVESGKGVDGVHTSSGFFDCAHQNSRLLVKFQLTTL